MSDWLSALEPHWAWLIAGVVLATAEMILPGFFLIWLAGAAIITGVLAWALPIGGSAQLLIFAVLAVVSVFIGRRMLARHPITSADPLMNDRGARLVGETVTVVQAISGGQGRVRHGDSEWIARGADAEPGTRLRVSGHDGAILHVAVAE